MQLGLTAARGFTLACPVGSSLVNPGADLSSASITVTMFLGIPSTTQVQYGTGGNITVPADATKVNVESANWWVPQAGLACCPGPAAAWAADGCRQGRWWHTAPRLLQMHNLLQVQ